MIVAMPVSSLAQRLDASTRGPIPCPEAQLDRFMVKLTVELPGRDDEIGILARHAAGFDPGNLAATGIRPVAPQAELAAASAAVREVRVAAEVAGYIVDLCRATRQSPSLRLGVSPRGATALQATSRACDLQRAAQRLHIAAQIANIHVGAMLQPGDRWLLHFQDTRQFFLAPPATWRSSCNATSWRPISCSIARAASEFAVRRSGDMRWRRLEKDRCPVMKSTPLS